MNWFEIVKTSALEQLWWNRFYEHLSKTAQFIFNEDMKIVVCRTVGKTFFSGVDGPKIFFGFCVLHNNKVYNCGINIEFNKSLIYSNKKWQNSNLVSLETTNDIELVKSNWYSVCDLGKNDQYVSGRGFLLPESTKPAVIMQKIKESILNDHDEDDDDGPEEYTDPTPDPSEKMELVPARRNRI